MKITISKSELTEAIGLVSKALSSRTTNPVLSGIKLEATNEGVQLTGGDSEIMIVSFIPTEDNEQHIIDIHRPGGIVIPAKFFSEMVRKLPSKEVHIDVNERFLTVITSGSAQVQIVGMDPEEYPTLPMLQEEQTISISSEVIRTMIRQTAFAVSANESSNVLTGVLWNIGESDLKFTACDRHRLATRVMSIDPSADVSAAQVVVPGRSLNELIKILPDGNKPIQIVVTDNQILFKIGTTLFYSRLLNGTYPDTSKLIPSQYQTELVIKRRQLAEAIDRAYLLSKEEKTNIVKLEMLDNETIEISSSSAELGKVNEQITTESVIGEHLTISFNSKYMLDSLKAIDSEQIHIGFTGKMQPIILTPSGENGALQLILPYRTMN